MNILDNIEKLKELLVTSDDNEKQYTSSEKCKECGGQCCKLGGCHLSVYDVSEDGVITYEKVKALLDTGLITIDYWEGDTDPDKNEYSRVYYLHTREMVIDLENSRAAFRLSDLSQVKYKLSPISYASWGGKCVLLGNCGCMLPFNKRPKGARHLMPIDDENCDSDFTKGCSAAEFREFHDIMERLYNEYEEKE